MSKLYRKRAVEGMCLYGKGHSTRAEGKGPCSGLVLRSGAKALSKGM